MPRQQRAYGRPGTTVVPPDWDTSHAVVITGTFPDSVSLRAPGGVSAWNPLTNRTEVVPHAPFATNVPARINAVGGATGDQPADDLVHVAGYTVSVPLTADGADLVVVNGENDTLIDVTDSADPTLVGKTLRVTDIVRGSTRFERDLLTTLND